MKQVVRRAGNVEVAEVPAPTVQPGTVLVRTVSSCISAGTEGAWVGGGTAGVILKAARSPEVVRRVLKMASDRGIANTAAAVRTELKKGSATGYSLAGVVEEVADDVEGVVVGDRVACAGAGVANHAEFAVVPANLVVRIPDGVGFDEASTVALGSIALHGVRRLEPTMGEWFVVLGLGLLGQLAVQLLQANGCHVVGLDLDASRVARARDLGLEHGIDPEEPDASQRVRLLTGGGGADGVLVTAASRSDEVMHTAFGMCRRKGRVVLIGDVGLGLQRGDIYARELEFRISTSYGPGRYDDRYERQGYDYPPAYVRWTESRNMAEYLRLIADDRVQVTPMIHERYPVEQAAEAYAALSERGGAPIVVLGYEPEPGPARRIDIRSAKGSRDTINMALIGAGSFGVHTHLPNLQRLRDRFTLRAVASRTGLNAQETARHFNAAYATTDPEEVLADDDVDAVLIATRHDSHGTLTLRALEAGKHVLVEKPLALDAEELDAIEAFYAKKEAAGEAAPVLLTGFNRRFSPHAVALRHALAGRTNPAMLLYRMNAGYIPLDHWVHTHEGGGRNIGEACHIYDLFHALVGAPVTAVEATPIGESSGHYARNDNFTATLAFQDGSVATLTYTALGTGELAKERLETFADGGAAVLDDYRELRLFRMRGQGVKARTQDKGHLAELRAFADAVAGGDWPIPLWQQLATTRVSFLVERLIREGGGRAGMD